MSGRANVGSVPCRRSFGHAEDDRERVVVHCMAPDVAIGVTSGEPEGTSPMFYLEPVAARALANLLLVAADTIERNQIEATRTLAIARSRR